ncbi:hypothetical protein BCR37DRAFT_239395 [Protomyces lactucae-debilis]|uniref:60S ribosomal subunit assembly/export protein loc1 n=1 Tax=Protomyces lactucae-debilis TaxID=2754530 RepID=A0A1Y2FQ69_PROLT|nr:uncharacterized protein BCR37DRAFT_239395 [Protomyces lactucae-debilis]ORY85474.1 hypothetical protein BCR37DRAFT_239395 [Protomyces lactucae-debilis]
MAPQVKGKKQTNNVATATGGLSKRRRKPKTYTEKQLGLKPLNTVAKPAGVVKRGKIGKVFADESAMQLILAEVNKKQEGQVRSKLQRVQDMEAVRERKRIEMEAKERSKAALLEKRKEALRHGGGERVSAAQKKEKEGERRVGPAIPASRLAGGRQSGARPMSAKQKGTANKKVAFEKGVK